MTLRVHGYGRNVARHCARQTANRRSIFTRLNHNSPVVRAFCRTRFSLDATCGDQPTII